MYPHAKFNDDGLQLSGASLVEFLRGHERAITALETLDASVLDQLPDLKVISKYGVGLDMIDTAAMSRLGKRLGWTPGVNRRSVSELVIAFMIAMLRQLPAANREVLSGTWRQHVGGTLAGRTVGIIGCGHIGKDLVPLLNAFGCTVLANDIRDYSEFYGANNVEPVGLDTLLKRSDVVTIHVPLDATTRNILSAEMLAMLKPTAVLVNAARGGLVDEAEVKRMLTDGRLAAAAFDVFADEPPTDKELLSLPNFLATPHIGGSAHEAIMAMGRAAIDGLENNRIPEMQ